MYQAFMVVLREGVEAFLMVAITFAYLRKTAQNYLLPAVWWGIFGSVAASAGIGYFLWQTEGANQPLWEGVFGLVTVVLVGSFVVHMWKMGPELKRTMERDISQAAGQSTLQASFLSIFLFTVVMISREGMETVLLLFQIRGSQLLVGALLGLVAAGAIALLWQQFGFLINWKQFFQVTTIFIILFILQVAFQTFHEFSEAGIIPNSDYWHKVTEPFSSEGVYGKWYANITFIGCGLWLLFSFARHPRSVPS